MKRTSLNDTTPDEELLYNNTNWNAGTKLSQTSFFRRRIVQDECPHCPVKDPVQAELEKTEFYDGLFSSDEEEEDDQPPLAEKPKEVCVVCEAHLDDHPPPYGPWCPMRKDLLEEHHPKVNSKHKNKKDPD